MTVRAPSASELLTIWERGQHLSGAQRALELLESAGYGKQTDLAQLPIGQRDERLLAVRERLFGVELACLADCPACGACLETDLNTGSLHLPTRTFENKTLTVTCNGCDILFRLPTTLDLTTLEPDMDPIEARRALANRCVIDVQSNGGIVPQELPENMIATLAEGMALEDPQADLQLALQCPTCEHRWLTPLDILRFLWLEIQAWATRLLREIHELASAYGWGEKEILALSPVRRQAYLNLVRG
jgi:hypothetical protein